MTLELGILLSLCCAVATNFGFLLKHRGACAAPEVNVRHPLKSAAGLFRSKWFAIGMLVAAGAWIFHVAALALAPLSIVQAVIAGGLVFLTVMAERWFGCHVRHPPVAGRRLHRPRAGAAGRHAAARRRRPLELLGRGHGRLRGRPAGGRRAAGALAQARHQPRAPRRAARHRGRRPLRRVRRGHQGAHRHGRRRGHPRASSRPGSPPASSPRSSPSTPRLAASRRARRCRSSPLPARPPTCRPSRAGSSSSATRSRATPSASSSRASRSPW